MLYSNAVLTNNLCFFEKWNKVFLLKVKLYSLYTAHSLNTTLQFESHKATQQTGK